MANCEGRDAMMTGKFRHVFLDAEGTLYVPKHGRSRWEFWADPSPELALEFFELDEGVMEALVALRGQVDTLCLASRNTRAILTALLDKFGLRGYFDDILLNGDKGKNIVRYLSKHGLSRDEAVMVGDMPRLDIYPVRDRGIEAILVDRVYNRDADAERISGVKDLPAWLRIAGYAEGIGKKKARISKIEEFVVPEGVGTSSKHQNLDVRDAGLPSAVLGEGGQVV